MADPSAQEIPDTPSMKITVNTGDTVPLSLYKEMESQFHYARTSARDWELKASELLVEVAALKAHIKRLPQ